MKWLGCPFPHKVSFEGGGAEEARKALKRIIEKVPDPKTPVLVVGKKVKRLWDARFVGPIRRSLGGVPVLTLADSEENKTLAELARLFEKLIALKIDRQGLLIAVGGGVLSDMVGFAAATYMRGIRWIAVPTTLTGLVDAGLGGKTGVDFGSANNVLKNMVGAFWPPEDVLLAPCFLETLPLKEFRNGLSEVVKTGVALDKRILALLEKSPEEVLEGEPERMARIIKACARAKMSVVAHDPRDKGRRAVLNLGHTVGHAMEAVGGFRKWSHGQAVAVGMMVANRLSRNRGIMTEVEERRVAKIVNDFGLLPKTIPRRKELMRAMGLDKKRQGNRLMIVLAGPLGNARVVSAGLMDLLEEENWSWPLAVEEDK